MKVVLAKPGGSGAGCVGHCARYQGQVQLQIKIKIIIIMPGTCPKKTKDTKNEREKFVNNRKSHFIYKHFSSVVA